MIKGDYRLTVYIKGTLLNEWPGMGADIIIVDILYLHCLNFILAPRYFVDPELIFKVGH